MPARPREVERRELLAALEEEGVSVSETQLRRWHEVWLLPQPRTEGKGRGRGSLSYYPEEAFQLAWFIGTYLKARRSLDLAGWAAWGHRFPVTAFARDLLLTTCERQTEDIERFQSLLGGPNGRAWAKPFKAAIGRSAEGKVYSGLPLGVFTEAWAAMLDAFLGKWHRRKRLDPRIPSVGAAMNQFGIDMAEQIVGRNSWHHAHPIAHALANMQIPDAMTAAALRDLSIHSSNPVLSEWLASVPDRELEAQRDAAQLFIAKCIARTGNSGLLDMEPSGFLTFLRIYVLRGNVPSLWHAIYDSLLTDEVTPPADPT